MKKLIAASVLAMGMMTTAATADVKVGLGFAAGSTAANEAPGVRVPIDFDFGLRLEPELGFKDNVFTMAFGAYYTVAKIEEVNLFAGGRFGYSSFNVGSGTSLQALVGAEYFVVPSKFSVATQIGLEFIGGDQADNVGTTGAVIGHYFF